MNIDMKTAVSSLTANTEFERSCWKCGDKSHVAKECPQKDTIKDLPLAPAYYQKKKGQRGRGDKRLDANRGTPKKVQIAAIAEEESVEGSSDDEFYHLDALVAHELTESPGHERKQ